MLTFYRKPQNGEAAICYGHQSFLSDTERKKIKDSKSLASSQTLIASGIAGIGAYYGAGKIKVIPKSIPAALVGLGTYGASYFIFGKIFKQSHNNRILEIVSKSGNFPLWLNKNSVLNLDRTYFSLDDSKNNEPNILHDGMAAERAQKLYPDFIVSQNTSIQKPHYPKQQHDHHH